MSTPSPSTSRKRTAGAATTTGQLTAVAAGKLPTATLTALGVALATEHAAVWAYGIVAAYDPADVDLINSITAGHLARRDDTIDLISAGGGKPVGAAAAYKLPNRVTDTKSARALADTIESDCAAAWRAVIGNTDNQALRTTALQGLSDSANWLTTLKLAAKTTPATVAFPGQSGS